MDTQFCDVKRCLLIAYSPEISLKGKNRWEFESRIKRSILKVIKDMSFEKENFTLTKEFSRFILIMPDSFTSRKDLIKNIRRISGVLFVAQAYMTELNIECIKQVSTAVFLSNLDGKVKSFKVDTKRSNKDYELTSPQINVEVASAIFEELENRGIDLKVDLKHPDKTLNIEILNHAFILLKKYEGVSGLPCGVEGKILIDTRQLNTDKDMNNLSLCSFLLIRRGVMPIILVDNFDNSLPEHIRKAINIISVMAGKDVDVITMEQYEKNEKDSKMLIAECSEKLQDLNLFDEKPWRFVFPLITDDNFKDKMNNLMRELFDEIQ